MATKRYRFTAEILTQGQIVDTFPIVIAAASHAEALALAGDRFRDAAVAYRDAGEFIALKTNRGRVVYTRDLEELRREHTAYMVVCHHAQSDLGHTRLFIHGTLANEHYVASAASGVYLAVILLIKRTGLGWEVVKSQTR